MAEYEWASGHTTKRPNPGEITKEIRVTIEMDGTRYGYRQHVDTDGTESPDTIRDYTAYAIASTIQNTIIEYWEAN